MTATDETAILASILAFPDEDTPRLMYADEIEESDPARAEFIRVQCELARTPDCNPIDPTADVWCRRCELCLREKELFAVLSRSFGESLGPLWSGHRQSQHLRCEQHTSFMPDRQHIVRRGFVDELHLPAEDWLRHADAIYWHPSQTVECPHDVCDHGVCMSGNLSYKCDVCEGTGRVPRPMPATAHPIRRVRLTGGQVPWSNHSVRDGTAEYYLLRGLGPAMRRGKTVRLPVVGILHTEIVRAVLEAEWPSITFDLPA